MQNNAAAVCCFDIKVGRPVASGKEEESPDRKGHPAAEIAEGSNLLESVTENNRLH